MAIIKQPSCDDPIEPALLPVAEAQRRLAELSTAVTTTEKVDTAFSANRVLAEPVVSSINVPSETNSAMDGYAITQGDIPKNGETSLTVVGEAFAGKSFVGTLKAGEAVRVFTGAVLPKGADTVVIQEHVAIEGNEVVIDSEVQAGRNVRHAGEDLTVGQTILEAGRQLTAADVGLIASIGITSVTVTRPVKVAFFSTGDEVHALDKADKEPLPEGMVYDSNRHTLRCLLQALHVEVIDLGIVRDTLEDTVNALRKAAENADVIVSSGGISAGEADYVTKAFHEVGDVSFWKLAMRPGRPLASGKIGNATFFGLPGNPVAVMVTFLAFVQPAIKQRMGITHTEPFAVTAVVKNAIKKSPGRTEYQRGITSLTEAGVLEVELTGKQGAGRLSSMSAANCLIVLGDDVNSVVAGDKVIVWPFHGLLA